MRELKRSVSRVQRRYKRRADQEVRITSIRWSPEPISQLAGVYVNPVQMGCTAAIHANFTNTEPLQLSLSATAYKTISVNRKGAERVLSGHPWVFSSDVSERGGAEPGSVVQIADPKGRILGTAHYSSTSQITIRMLSTRPETIDRSWFLAKLQAALEYRKRFVRESDAYRVVFGEADGLPGLVVDRYGDYIAIQTLNQGMDRARAEIVSCLEELMQPKAIIARNDVAVRTREALPVETEVLTGSVPDRVTIQMNGLTWHVDPLHGQKTGIFLDQRENYLAAAQFGKGRALDCFTFSGGFALHLARTCDTVEAVDSSEHSLALARANAETNGVTNVSFTEADVFDLLTGYSRSGAQFDTIVLDPPAFTKSRSAVEGAARGYREINQRALRLLRSGGILVSCSCSHHYSEAMLLETIAAAALDAHRTVRVIERRTQALDHPILLTVPETHYLKCLILHVV